MIKLSNINILTRPLFHYYILNKKILYIFIPTILMMLAINSVLNFVNSDLFVAEHKFTDYRVLYLVMAYFNFIFAVVLGHKAYTVDKTSGVIPIFLSYPVSKAEYYISRILGAWIILVGYYLVSMLIAGIYFKITMNAQIFYADVYISLGLLSIKMLAMITLSLFLAITISNLVATFSITYVIYILNSVSPNFEDINTPWKTFKYFSSYLFPRFGHWSRVTNSLIYSSSDQYNITFESIHLVAMIVLYMYIGCKVFSLKTNNQKQ